MLITVNIVMMRIFGHKMDEVRGELRILLNAKLQTSYPSECCEGNLIKEEEVDGTCGVNFSRNM
jgi:hypothetical protein